MGTAQSEQACRRLFCPYSRACASRALSGLPGGCRVVSLEPETYQDQKRYENADGDQCRPIACSGPLPRRRETSQCRSSRDSPDAQTKRQQTLARSSMPPRRFANNHVPQRRAKQAGKSEAHERRRRDRTSRRSAPVTRTPANRIPQERGPPVSPVWRPCGSTAHRQAAHRSLSPVRAAPA